MFIGKIIKRSIKKKIKKCIKRKIWSMLFKIFLKPALFMMGLALIVLAVEVLTGAISSGCCRNNSTARRTRLRRPRP